VAAFLNAIANPMKEKILQGAQIIKRETHEAIEKTLKTTREGAIKHYKGLTVKPPVFRDTGHKLTVQDLILCEEIEVTSLAEVVELKDYLLTK
jgi:hypothetical protein